MSQMALHALKPAAPVAPASEREARASLTYEPFYFLQEKPFSLAADPRFLFKSRAHALAFDELSGAIRRREGLVVLTGEIGTGKTTLCRAVLDELDRRTFSAFVADPFLSREDLLKMLLVEYGVVSLADLNAGRLQGWTRQELSFRLYDFLDSLVPLQAFAVLVVDEAQNLSLPLLEEIRILNDLERREKLIQVVLVGQPELRSRLKLPQLRQVEQRVAMRCELKALGREEVAAYVEHRLNVARASASSITFSHGALDVVHHASAGVPRLINLICDRALHEAHRLSVSRRVEPAIVWKAMGALGIDVTPATAPRDPGVGVVALEDPARDEVRVRVAADLPCEPANSTPAEQPDLDDEEIIDAPLRADVADADPQLELLLREPEDSSEDEIGIDSEGSSIAEFGSEEEEEGQRSRGEGQRLEVAEQEGEGGRSLEGSGVRRFAIAAGLALTVLAAAGIPFAGDIAAVLTADASIPRFPPAPVLEVPMPLTPAAAADAAGASDLAAGLPGSPTETYVVEVALFSGPERAGRAVQELTAGGYPAYVRDLTLGARRFAQVLAGAFRSRAEAEIALEGIRDLPGYADARVRSASN